MSRRSDGSTGELFSSIPEPMPQTPGAMDYRAAVAEQVSDMLAKAKSKGHDRYDIAARMSRLADHETSKALIDSYTAPSREECNLPFWKAPLMGAACDDRALAEWHASVLGGRILWGREILDADLGGIDRQIAELRDRKRLVQALQGKQLRGRG